MTSYPTKPTGDNIIDTSNIFASSNTSKIIMSTSEILNGYNNDGEAETPLTSKPDGDKFNFFWYQVHNTLSWCVGYISALFDNKLEKSGDTMSGALAMGLNKITGLSAGTANTDAVNKAQLDEAVNGAMWLGEVKYLSYPSIPTLPAGIEIVNADGRALSKTTYSTLYSIIGTTFGGTEGGTTFNIPDLRGKYPVGWNGSGSLDSGRLFGIDQVRENSKYTWKYDFTNPVNKNWGTTYTATQDGYISFYARCNAGQTGYFTLNSNIIAKNYNGTDGVNYLQGGFPIVKGDEYIASGATGGTTEFSLKFYPKILTTNSSSSTQTNIALYPVIRIK